MRLFLVASCCAVSTYASINADTPEQVIWQILKTSILTDAATCEVHLALGMDKSSMNVAWTTQHQTASAPVVRWAQQGQNGTAPPPFKLYDSVEGDSRAFTQDANRTWYTHAAVMTGLQPDTRYW